MQYIISFVSWLLGWGKYIELIPRMKMTANNAQCYGFKSLYICFESAFPFQFISCLSQLICLCCRRYHEVYKALVCCMCFSKQAGYIWVNVPVYITEPVRIPLTFLLRSTGRVTIAFGCLLLMWLENGEGGRQESVVNHRTKPYREL